eukprot:2874465-Rhodomonas_salina.1
MCSADHARGDQDVVTEAEDRARKQRVREEEEEEKVEAQLATQAEEAKEEEEEEEEEEEAVVFGVSVEMDTLRIKLMRSVCVDRMCSCCEGVFGGAMGGVWMFLAGKREIFGGMCKILRCDGWNVESFAVRSRRCVLRRKQIGNRK